MSLLDTITSVLSGGPQQMLSSALGMDDKKTGSAISAALPLIMGALARNSQKEEGASALAGALDRDHDGSIMDNLGSLISNPAAGAGSGILKHVLGSRQPVAEQGVSKAAGIDIGQAATLLTTLAPVVMGVLGKTKREKNLDANGVSSLLGEERQRTEESGSSQGSFIGKLLDRDGDGDTDLNDISALLGGLFS